MFSNQYFLFVDAITYTLLKPIHVNKKKKIWTLFASNLYSNTLHYAIIAIAKQATGLETKNWFLKAEKHPAIDYKKEQEKEKGIVEIWEDKS